MDISDSEISSTPEDTEASFCIDDGGEISSIKAHSLKKHRLIRLCASMFAGATKKKWDYRVYIDLFAGPGYSRISDNGKIVKTSPLIALEVQPTFDKFIFCEENERLLESLKIRVKKLYPSANVAFILGDCNKNVEKILREIPSPSSSNRVLCFCLVDPFKAADLHFSTIRVLNRYFMDFLVLIPDKMDIGRNKASYLASSTAILGDFLGNSEWKKDWKEWCISKGKPGHPKEFALFALEYFIKQMETLGFKSMRPSDMERVEQVGNQSPLYKLALFSRHNLGLYLFNQAKKYATDQRNFFDRLSPKKRGDR